jgi:hypothetical protein
MLSHFRGVVWPRKNDNKKTYRYVVIGMVVTNEPLENLEGKNEIVLDGHAGGIAEAINTIVQKKAAFRIGDANDVLTRLEDLIAEED